LRLVSSTASRATTETTLSLPGLFSGLSLGRLCSRLSSSLYLALRSLWSLRAQQPRRSQYGDKRQHESRRNNN